MNIRIHDAEYNIQNEGFSVSCILFTRYTVSWIQETGYSKQNAELSIQDTKYSIKQYTGYRIQYIYDTGYTKLYTIYIMQDARRI